MMNIVRIIDNGVIEFDLKNFFVVRFSKVELMGSLKKDGFCLGVY